MCGRMAAVPGRPVFDSIRMRLGFGMGLVALIASTLVNVLNAIGRSLHLKGSFTVAVCAPDRRGSAPPGKSRRRCFGRC